MQSVANNSFLTNFITGTPEIQAADAARIEGLSSGFGLGASFIRLFVPVKRRSNLFNALLCIPGFLQLPYKNDLSCVVGIMRADIGDRWIPFF
jgi:hypothetical protein